MFECPKLDERAFAYYPRLAKLKSYVDKNYFRKIDLEFAASITGLEKTYFSKFFHNKTGVCYHDWLSWVRVNNSIALLQASDIPITRLAFEVGFNDLRTFERAFEKHAGMTPSQMKQKVRPGKKAS